MVERKDIVGQSPDDLQKILDDLKTAVDEKEIDAAEFHRLAEEIMVLIKTLPPERVTQELVKITRSAIDYATKLTKPHGTKFIHGLATLGEAKKKLSDKEKGSPKPKQKKAPEKPMEQLEKIENFVKNDPLLKAIFTGTHKRKVAALNKIGTSRTTENILEQPFYLRGLEHFEKIVKESLADSMKVKQEDLPEDILKLKDFSMWMILNSKDIEKDLKKIKSDLELDLDVHADIKHKPAKKPAETEPAPAQPAKASDGMESKEKPKPPTPSADKVKESEAQAKEREKQETEKEAKAEKKEVKPEEAEKKGFEDIVRDKAPAEYKEWEETYLGATQTQVRGYGPYHKDKYIGPFGFPSSQAVNEVKEALKSKGFSELVDAGSPVEGLKKMLDDIEKMDDEELKKAIKEKTEALTTAVKSTDVYAKQKAKEDKEKAAPHPLAQEPKATDLKQLINKQPIEEKAFFDSIAAYVSDKPEKAALFIQMMEFLAKDAEGHAAIEALQKKLSKHLRPLRKLNAETLKNETLLDNLFSSVSPLKSEIENALQDQEKIKQETNKRTALLRMQNQTLRAEFTKIFEILDLKPESIKSKDARHNLGEVQEVCRKFIDKIDHKELEDKDLNERKKDIDELRQNYESNIKPHIEDLEKVAQLRPAAPAQPPSGAGPAVAPTAGPTPTAAPTTPAPQPAPDLEIYKVKEIPGFEKETAAVLRAVLQNKKILDPTPRTIRKDKQPECLTDPVCRAINEVIKKAKEKDTFDIKLLITFLQNPELLNKSIDEAKVNAEMATKNAKNLQELIQKLKDEEQDINDFFEGIRGRRPTKDEETKADSFRKRKREVRELIRQSELLNKLKQRNLDYDSPRHVLALIHFFLNQEDDNYGIEQINHDLETRVQAEKKALAKGFRAGLDKCAFLLKPSLENTLRTLATKDKDFSKLGDNPGQTMAELAGILKNDPLKVKEWIENLPGGFEKNIHSTVPRLIAYLEVAIRDGKVSYLLKTGRTQELVNHLKGIQHKQLMKEVEEEFRKTPTMNTRDKMILYFEKMRQSSESANDISKKILTNNLLTSYGLKGGGIVASAGLGIYGGVAYGGLATLSLIGATFPGLTAIPAWIASQLENTPMTEENKAMTERIAKRTILANGLGIGGALLGGLIAAPIALPLGIAGAITGALSPELKKHHKAIYEKGKPVAKFTFQKILPTAIKVPWWALKYTIGLPAVLVYYGLKAKKK